MSNGYYLLDNPPARSQYRTPRRAAPTGCIVLHTAESTTDRSGADPTAENVANFIRTRSDAGCYHQIADRDSIVKMVPFSYETWHDRFSNRWSIGISLAMRAADWPTLSVLHRNQLLDNMVAMAVDAGAWLRDERGIEVPASRISKAQSEQGLAGFIAHGDRDPGRRTDPGPGFPWDEFLQRFATATNKEVGMADDPEVEVWQRALLANGADLGTFGPNDDGVDGDFGPTTLAQSIAVLDDRNAKIRELDAQVVDLSRALATAESRIAELEAAANVDVTQIAAALTRIRSELDTIQEATGG